MITTTIAVLLSVIAISTALALIDFGLRASSAFVSLKHQSKLAAAGFVPQVEADIVRLRPSMPRVSPGAPRQFARRLPARREVFAQAHGAA